MKKLTATVLVALYAAATARIATNGLAAIAVAQEQRKVPAKLTAKQWASFAASVASWPIHIPKAFRTVMDSRKAASK